MAVSATHKGWRFNIQEDRLEALFNGVRVFHIDDDGLSIVALNGTTLPVQVNGPGDDGENILTALEGIGILQDISS